jgi:predicted DNA-binding WGR domain protein
VHKINKKMADFEGQEASVSADLEIHDPGENHNKFWRIRVYGSIVVRHWGRHGAKGQQMAEDHGSEWAAKSAARDLRDDKMSKGYKTEVGVLDRFAREM